MEDFHSNWEELQNSLDTLENSLNNIEVANGMNGYKSSELEQQMLEMRDDPAMSYHTTQHNSSIPDDKDSSGIDCSSLSSEIFFATRLLHDETLDSTTLTMDEPESSPYNNEHRNYSNYLESPLQNDSSQQDTIDSVGGLNQQETLDSDFLYNSFGQLNSNRPELHYDEEYSNKSWTEFKASEIMPAPVRISKKNRTERKFKGEKRKRTKINKKNMQTLINNITESNFNSRIIQTQIKVEKFPEEKSATLELPSNNNIENQIKQKHSITKITSPMINQEPTVPIKSDFQRTNLNMYSAGKELVRPSTSGVKTQYVNGRKVPSYLRMFKMKDEKYTEVFACKVQNCFGIFTTLDSAIFHPCVKKRRGRRPKILEDCVVPL